MESQRGNSTTDASSLPPYHKSQFDSQYPVESDDTSLLQMPEAAHDPFSQNLKAAMDPPKDQPAVSTPLLLQRPRSSGIDITAFSFAKPVHQHKSFTLRQSTKQVSLKPTSGGHSRLHEEQSEASQNDAQLLIAKER